MMQFSINLLRVVHGNILSFPFVTDLDQNKMIKN